MSNEINLVGKTFERLTVLRKELAGKWLCRCSCGVEKSIPGPMLRYGKAKSCGCLRRELGRAHGAKINLRHGEGSNGAETSEYRTWAAMLSRCNNSQHAQFMDYGGRGITVCERWDPKKGGSYENFLADMGRRPAEDFSIDREDNDEGYSPENCRWATDEQQNRNQRVRKAKRDLNGNLVMPKTGRGRPAQLYEWNGRLWTLRELAIVAEIPLPTLRARLYSGQDLATALEV